MAPTPANTAVIGVSDIEIYFGGARGARIYVGNRTLTAYFGNSFQSYSRTQCREAGEEFADSPYDISSLLFSSLLKVTDQLI